MCCLSSVYTFSYDTYTHTHTHTHIRYDDSTYSHTTSFPIRVWFPESVRIHADDTSLGAIYSSSSASCETRYQWTQLRAEATLQATGISDTIKIGVTQYVTFESTDVNVVAISENIASGVSNGMSTISITSLSSAVSISSTQITVDSSSSVVVALRAEVITSITSSTTLSSVYPNPYETFEITSYGSQVLNQEGASGRLLVYTTFDGSASPYLVSSSEESFSYTNNLNESVILDSMSSPPTVTVATGATYACGTFLSIDWQASCGETISSTDVTLLLNMPDVSSVIVTITHTELMLPADLASALSTLFESCIIVSLFSLTQVLTA